MWPDDKDLRRHGAAVARAYPGCAGGVLIPLGFTTGSALAYAYLVLGDWLFEDDGRISRAVMEATPRRRVLRQPRIRFTAPG